MNPHSLEMRELCYKIAQKRFHDKLSEIIEPLVEMFIPKPPPTPQVE